jgi:hypothetical protein
MKTTETNNWLFQLLGITFFVQAATSLAGGLLFKSLESKSSIEETLVNLSNHMPIFYISLLLEFVTAIVILMLGIALYETAGSQNKTLAKIALALYGLEAFLLTVGQVFLVGLVKVSDLYFASGDTGLLKLGEVLLKCRHFSGEIAMLPFGIGAILFYYLLMKSQIIPRWLALWGLSTAPYILLYFTLGNVGISLPFALCILYVPYEFFVGIFILVKYRKAKPVICMA